MQTSQTVIALDGKLIPTGNQSFRVDYKLTNRASEPVFLLDQILNRSDPRLGPDPNRAYTLQGEPGELILFKGLLPIPDGLQVESPEVPYAQKLEAGSAIVASFEMPKIIAHDNPYDYAAIPEVVDIKSVSLQIGFMAASQASGPGEKIQRSDKTLFRFHYRELFGRQSIAGVGLGDVALQLVRRG